MFPNQRKFYVGGRFFFAPYKTDTIQQPDNLQALNYFVTFKVITMRVSSFIYDSGLQ
jgi:hypothetical protein